MNFKLVLYIIHIDYFLNYIFFTYVVYNFDCSACFQFCLTNEWGHFKILPYLHEEIHVASEKIVLKLHACFFFYRFKFFLKTFCEFLECMCIIKKKLFLSKRERKKITSKLNAWHFLIWPEASSQLFKGNGVWMSTGSTGVMCVKSLLDSALSWIVQRRIVQKVPEHSLMHVQPFVAFADDFKTPKPPCKPWRKLDFAFSLHPLVLPSPSLSLLREANETPEAGISRNKERLCKLNSI